jgi:hypothetical protein
MATHRPRDRDPRPVGGRAPARFWPVAVAAAAFVAILTARFWVTGSADSIGMLCTVPVALLAVAYGSRGGIIGTAVGVGFLAVWVIIANIHLSVLGWAARSVPLLLVGVLLGAVVERLRRTDDERLRLVAVAARHRESVEINDTIVQGMSAAKWSLESGNTEAALTILSDTVELGHRLVSDLIRENNLDPSWTSSPDASS